MHALPAYSSTLYFFVVGVLTFYFCYSNKAELGCSPSTQVTQVTLNMYSLYCVHATRAYIFVYVQAMLYQLSRSKHAR